MSALDQFQSGFRPAFGMKTALVALVDDFCLKLDGIVFSVDTMAFCTIDYFILIHQLKYEVGFKGIDLV